MINPVKVAIVGYGTSAKVFHAPLLNYLSDYEIISVHERNKYESLKDLPHVKIERTYDAILADCEVELVIITTPNQVHYVQAKAALLAGKHVVVEKPFTVTADEALELVTLAKQVDKTLTVFHNRRWDSDFLWLKDLVNSGIKIYEIESRFDRFRDYLKGWKEEEGEGSGILYDLGSHLIDQMLVLFGNDLQLKYVDLGKQRKVAKAIDSFEIHFKANNIKVVLKASMTCSHSYRLKVDTEKGTFIKRDMDVQENILKNKGVSFSKSTINEEEVEFYSSDGQLEKIKLPKGNYLAFYEQLFLCLRKNKFNPVSGQDALSVMLRIEEVLKWHATVK